MLEKLKIRIKSLSLASKIKSVVFIVLAFLAAVLLIIINKTVSKLYDQHAAQYWDENNNAYQITLLFDEEAKVNNDTVMELMHNYTKDLKATIGGASFINTENEDSSYADYAYMAEGNVSLNFESRNVSSIKTYGVSGDYFLFHPYEMISGSFFDKDEFHKDCVVLDENTAYSLFGSADVIGMTLYAGDVPLVVKGVYKAFETKYDKAAKGFETLSNAVVLENGSVSEAAMDCLIYMPFDTLCALSGDKNITCLELVSVSPSESFMYNKITEKMQSYISHMEIVKNSSRFGIGNMFSVVNMGAKRSMHVNKIDYPYFENVARAYEDVIANYYILVFVFSLIDTVLFVSFLHHKYVNRKIHFSTVVDKYERLREKMRQSGNKQKKKWEHF